MTDTPWTKGPWKVGEVIANSPSTRVDAGDMEPVAWVYEVSDAYLIAAAPEMAELLVEARHLLHGEYCTRTYCDDEAHGAIDVLLARIHGQDGETA